MKLRDDFERITYIISREMDAQAIKQGKGRQSAIWRNEETDYLPLLIFDSETPEISDLKHWTIKEQFFDKEKMLIEQLKSLIGVAKSHSDAQLSIRVNLGVGILPTIFGLQAVFTQEDQMPWFVGHLSKDEIAKTGIPEDIKECGLIQKVIEYLYYFKSLLPNEINIYCFDTQGPFDIAHLIRGHQIYTDFYDDPDFVHHLMRISTKIYIEGTKLFKNIMNEPLDSGYHGMLFMDKGGVRLCDDSSINLSPSLFSEFVMPYIKEALAPFGGGWVHFCGDGNHLIDLYLEIEEVRGLNFGNPEKYDYEITIRKILSKDKFYVGYIPRIQGERLENYFKRILAPLSGKKKGLILQIDRCRGDVSAEAMMDLWHSIQDELF